MILVDSSVWIAYFNGSGIWQVDELDKILGNQELLIGDLILSEVLQGFRSDKDFNQAKEFLDELLFCQIGGYENAVRSAKNFRTLRKQGITVRKTMDVFIATYCIEYNIALLHADKDFEPFESYLELETVKRSS